MDRNGKSNNSVTNFGRIEARGNKNSNLKSCYKKTCFCNFNEKQTLVKYPKVNINRHNQHSNLQVDLLSKSAIRKQD